MSDKEKPEPGTVGWLDLTVDDAEQIRDFYREVAGWKADTVSMGDYDDFVMSASEGGTVVGGICHARGTNAGLPAQWMIYVNVEDLDASTRRCTDLGGEVLVGPKQMGSHGRYSVIRDPAGAVSALFEPAG